MSEESRVSCLGAVIFGNQRRQGHTDVNCKTLDGLQTEAYTNLIKWLLQEINTCSGFIY
jgi:hypothetical protein